MIIPYDTPGQLGNQLWAYSNMIAVAKTNNVRAVIILQESYCKLLDENGLAEARKNKIYILRAGTLKTRFYKKAFLLFLESSNTFLRKLFGVKIINDGTERLTDTISKNKRKIYIVNAWEQRVHSYDFINQRDFIRSIILPELKSRSMAEEQIFELRKSFDNIIAVHIRRGDYKEFLDGKYYFEDDVYLKKMMEVEKLLSPATVCFAIFSNENINLKNFEGINISFKNTNTAIGDMWGISLCNYIMGPLSTFSMWASFLKNVPLLFLNKETAIKSLSEFSPVIAQDVQQKDKVSNA